MRWSGCGRAGGLERFAKLIGMSWKFYVEQGRGSRREFGRRDGREKLCGGVRPW